MKAIVIKGCKDCPYKQFNMELENYECFKFGFELGSNPSEHPAPDCNLNDLPTDEEIQTYCEKTNVDRLIGMDNVIKMGANYVLKQITK